MGHSWREIDPRGAAAQDYYWDRVHKLRDKFKDVSLSHFTVGELGLLMKLHSLASNAAGTLSLSDYELTVLEEKALQIESVAHT